MRDFTKPPLSVPEQLALLKQRGLQVRDDQRAQQLLEVVTLFRLSPYMRPFQYGDDPAHRFRPGASLAQIVAIHRFDGALRHLVMDALERVEVAARACISNHMCCATGDAHWYLDAQHFKRHYPHGRLIDEVQEKRDKERDDFQRDVARIERSRASEAQKAQRIENRKRDNYARYYGATYQRPPLPPSWAMLEDVSMGAVSRIFQGLARDADRKAIARRFDAPGDVFGSWLHTLTFVRNICAHHGRLWNRELGVAPQLPKNWQVPTVAAELPRPAHRVYIVLTILAHLMPRISPDTHWRERLERLLADSPAEHLKAMGFPEHWRNQPQWQHLQLDGEK